MFNSVPEFEEDLNRLKRVDFVYTTCEAGKRRSVNHTRVRSLASPSRAEAEAVGVGVGAGRTGGAVRMRVQCDVMC